MKIDEQRVPQRIQRLDVTSLTPCSGKDALTNLACLALGNWQDSSHIQRSEVQYQRSMHLALVVLFQTTPKANIQPLGGGNSDKDTSKKGYIAMRTTCPSEANGQERRERTLINIPELKTVWKTCQKYKDEMRGNFLLSDRQHSSSRPIC